MKVKFVVAIVFIDFPRFDRVAVEDVSGKNAYPKSTFYKGDIAVAEIRTRFEEGLWQIPHVAITFEDAENGSEAIQKAMVNFPKHVLTATAEPVPKEEKTD